MLLDTHCHLDDKVYQDDIDTVLTQAKQNNIKQFIIPGADITTLNRAVELSEKYTEIFFAVGVHPYDIEQYDESILKQFITHKKCVAVGECGLDYYRLPKDNEQLKKQIKLKQKEVFIAQINLAKQYNKPLIIHIRDASNDSKKILIEQNAKDIGGVLHCFNADEQLLSLSEHNFYFGIGGVVTFKNAKKLINILPKIPLEKIILETDAPYLTPHPYRGTRNEPKYIKNILEKISEVLNISQERLEQQTTQNSYTLFKDLEVLTNGCN